MGRFDSVCAHVVRAAQTEAFQSKPIKRVIAFPAGGLTDTTLRVLADHAAKVLGQPVVAMNRALGARRPHLARKPPQPTATRSRRSRSACSARPTAPRSLGTQ